MVEHRSLRRAVMDEQDRVYEATGGDTPEHIIFSEEIYNWLDDTGRFEMLKSNAHRPRKGFIGMQAWYSDALDERGKVALLLSDEAFHEIAPKAEDFK